MVQNHVRGAQVALNRIAEKELEALAFLTIACLNAFVDFTLWLKGHTSYKLYQYGGRDAIASHVDHKYGHDTATIRGRVAREAMVWQVMSVGIALVITLFVIGVLDSNLPSSGNSDFDNATENTTVDIAGNIEDLGPLLVLLILLSAAIMYVFILRDQGMG